MSVSQASLIVNLVRGYFEVTCAPGSDVKDRQDAYWRLVEAELEILDYSAGGLSFENLLAVCGAMIKNDYCCVGRHWGSAEREILQWFWHSM